MKKHFLLLLWMTLLPLAGWADGAADLIVKPSLATGLIYNGKPQQLVVGSYALPADYDNAVGGVLWKVTTENTTPTEGGALEATATDAGTYYVWYKVLKDNGEYTEDGPWKKLTEGGSFCRISKATPNVTAPEVYKDLVYNADPQALIKTAASVDGGGAISYSLDGGANWYADIADEHLKGTNAGDYTITYKVEASTNYTAVENAIVPASIAKLSIGDGTNPAEGFVVEVKEANLNQTYTGKFKLLPENFTVKFKKADGETYKVLTWSNDYNFEGKNAIDVPADDATEDQKPYVRIWAKSGSNYTGGARAYFNIVPKDIDNLTYKDPLTAAQNYAGTKIEPTTEGMITYTYKTNPAQVLVKDKDFEVEYGANKNVGTEAGTITITGKGNYTGKKVLKFDISPVNLYVDATDYTANIGTALAKALIADNYKFRGWVGDDITTNPTVTGKPTMAFATGATTNNAGTFNDMVEVSDITGMSVDNYTITIGNKANLIVAKSDFTITFKENITPITYGDDLPNFSANYGDYVNVSIPAAVTGMTIKMYDAEGNEVTSAPNAGDYTLKVTAATIAEANYNQPTLPENGAFKVNPLKLKLVAQTQEVTFDTGEPKLKKNALPDGEGVNTTWSDAILQLQDANGKSLGGSKTAFVAKYKVWKENFVESLTWEEYDRNVIAKPGIIKVNLKNDISSNFDVETEDGAVTYTGIESDITITRLDATENPTPGTEVAEKLKMYHGAKANIKLTATSSTEAFNTIKANRWYSLVLPFNTSVREVSQAFGYAVVDIMDESSSNTTDIDFRLYLGELEANKPFIFKVDEDIDLKSNPVTFTGEEIVYSAEPVASTADGKVKFIGVYDGKKGFSGHEYIFSLGSGNISGTKETSYVVPMGAYIHMEEQMDGMSNSPEFHIEEPDGMTTSIKAIDFAKEGSAASSEGWYNLNGVQLESAPNQKGVYIQNGKKIVIK